MRIQQQRREQRNDVRRTGLRAAHFSHQLPIRLERLRGDKGNHQGRNCAEQGRHRKVQEAGEVREARRRSRSLQGGEDEATVQQAIGRRHFAELPVGEVREAQGHVRVGLGRDHVQRRGSQEQASPAEADRLLLLRPR